MEPLAIPYRERWWPERLLTSVFYANQLHKYISIAQSLTEIQIVLDKGTIHEILPSLT